MSWPTPPDAQESWGWATRGTPEWQRIRDGADGLAAVEAALDAGPASLPPLVAPPAHPDPTLQARSVAAQTQARAREAANDAAVRVQEAAFVTRTKQLRWRVAHPEFPRANEDAVRLRIRRYIRQLIGPLPWVQRVFPCTVQAVNQAARTCTVVFAERGAADPLPGVGYGLHAPIVGGQYALRWPVKLPDDPDVPAQPRLYGRPWIKVPGGVERWLYYRRWVGGHVWRVHWPVTTTSRHFDLGAVPAPAFGFIPYTLTGYSQARQSIVLATHPWQAFATPATAPAHATTALLHWSQYGVSQPAAPAVQSAANLGRYIYIAAVNPDPDPDEPDPTLARLWMAGVEPTTTAYPQPSGATSYGQTTHVYRVSPDGGVTWPHTAFTLGAERPWFRFPESPAGSRFQFDTYGLFPQRAWTVQPAEATDALPVGTPVVGFAPLITDFPIPNFDNESWVNRLVAPFRHWLRIWTWPGGAAAARDLGATDYAGGTGLLCPTGVATPELAYHFLADLFRSAAPRPWNPTEAVVTPRHLWTAALTAALAPTWTSRPLHLGLATASRTADLILATDTTARGNFSVPYHASMDYGATWDALPAPFDGSVGIHGDVLLVDIPGDHPAAQEPPDA